MTRTPWYVGVVQKILRRDIFFHRTQFWNPFFFVSDFCVYPRRGVPSCPWRKHKQTEQLWREQLSLQFWQPVEAELVRGSIDGQGERRRLQQRSGIFQEEMKTSTSKFFWNLSQKFSGPFFSFFSVYPSENQREEGWQRYSSSQQDRQA